MEPFESCLFFEEREERVFPVVSMMYDIRIPAEPSEKSLFDEWAPALLLVLQGVQQELRLQCSH